MMTARQNALVKTAMVLGLIAIILALGTVWPAFVGYFMITVFFGTMIFLVYMMFLGYEEHKELRRRD